MLQRYVVMAAAWLEIIVGVLFIAVPDLPCVLLFAAKPEGIGVPVARFAGLAFLLWGLPVCLPRPQYRAALWWVFVCSMSG
jgi:hypothetical protein